MIIDMHTHIVPGVDDGATSLHEAISLLKMLKTQGVGTVIATPHFYADSLNLEEYIKKVSDSFAVLNKAVKNQGFPQMFLGYEVLYFNNISSCDVLNKLSINNSRHILIELPYDNINDRVLDDIYNIQFNQGLIPIIAHIERYSKYKGFSNLIELVENSDIEAQINADSILSGPYKRVSLKLISSGVCKYIASDAHSVAKRPPRIAGAYERIEKKLGANTAKRLQQYGEELCRQLIQPVSV